MVWEELRTLHQGAFSRLAGTRHHNDREHVAQRFNLGLDESWKVRLSVHITHTMGDYHLRQGWEGNTPPNRLTINSPVLVPVGPRGLIPVNP